MWKRGRSAVCLLSVLAATMMPAQSSSEEASILPSGIDHIIYASADLQQGMDEIESLLGVRPVRGGHHPQYGTHNALLSLGPGIYLEIIARDPELAAPKRGALVNISSNTKSRLVTWVYRADDIQETAAAAKAAAIGIGPVESGSRTTPEGSEISWQLTDPYAMPMDGAVPFLIDWGRTVHPSTVLPSGGHLVQLLIEHPEPNRVQNALSILGVELEVVAGEEFGLFATITTETGPVILK